MTASATGRSSPRRSPRKAAAAASVTAAKSKTKGKSKASGSKKPPASTDESETRYSDLAAILGEPLRAKVASSRILMVGAGGIGCELLKNLVLCGFNEIEVVDLDTIDLSNLNRQFLFQSQHIKQSKAKIARDSALKFNPSVQVIAHHASIFDPKFDMTWFRSFTLVMSALDNVAARRHVNMMCVAAKVPLIESGTAGYHGQVAIHPPRLSDKQHDRHAQETGDAQNGTVLAKTACYDCHPKPAERKTYPVCTIRSTPNEPIHCVVWAKNYLYSVLFGVGEDDEMASNEKEASKEFAENAKEIGELKAESDALRQLRESMSNPGYPRRVFEKVFGSDIRRLLGMEDLWKSHKKPKTLDYDALIDDNVSELDTASLEFDQRVWDVKQSARVFISSIDSLTQELLERRNSDPSYSFSFDKDDEPSLNFVTAAANLRAECFDIPRKSRFDVKQMAGNIIPAIATTNAMVAGMMVMLAFKTLSRGDLASEFTNTYINYGGDRTHFLSNETLPVANPSCAVCSVTYLTLKINTKTSTLRDFVEKVLCDASNNGLGLRGEISVQRDQSLVYDVEFDDNLDTRLSSLSIAHGTRLNATSEDDSDDNLKTITVALFVEEWEDAAACDFELQGDRTLYPKTRLAVTAEDQDAMHAQPDVASTTNNVDTNSRAAKRHYADEDELLEPSNKRARVELKEDSNEFVILDDDDEHHETKKSSSSDAANASNANVVSDLEVVELD